MQNYYYMSAIFLIFCLSYNVVALDPNCDCDILQIWGIQIPKIYNSKPYQRVIYTKQSIPISGKPFYVSNDEDTIWWNDTSSSWDFHQFGGTWLNIVTTITLQRMNTRGCHNSLHSLQGIKIY